MFAHHDLAPQDLQVPLASVACITHAPDEKDRRDAIDGNTDIRFNDYNKVSVNLQTPWRIFDSNRVDCTVISNGWSGFTLAQFIEERKWRLTQQIKRMICSDTFPTNPGMLYDISIRKVEMCRVTGESVRETIKGLHLEVLPLEAVFLLLCTVTPSIIDEWAMGPILFLCTHQGAKRSEKLLLLARCRESYQLSCVPKDAEDKEAMRNVRWAVATQSSTLRVRLP